MISRRAEEFEQALRRAADGDRVAPHLLPLVQVANLAAALADPPPPAPHNLAPGRQRFLAAAAQYRSIGQEQKGPFLVARGPRWGMALVGLFLLFGLMFGAGQVAATSLPGQPLYALKLVAGHARMALTVDQQTRADLTLAFAAERFGEVVSMLTRGQPAPDTTWLERQLWAALREASEIEGPGAGQALGRLELAIQGWEQVMTQYVDGPAVAGQGPWPIVQAMEQVRNEARIGQEDPQELRRRLRQGEPFRPTEHPDGSQTPEPGASPLRGGGAPTAGTGTGTRPSPSATPGDGSGLPTVQPRTGPRLEPPHALPGAGSAATFEPRPSAKPHEGSSTPRAQRTARPAAPQPTVGPKHTPQGTDQVGRGATSTPVGPQPTEPPGAGSIPGPRATSVPKDPNPTSEPGRSPGPQPSREPGGSPTDGPGGVPGPDSPPPSGSGDQNGSGNGGKP